MEGTLSILSHELSVRGTRDGDGRLHLFHQIVTAVSAYPCQSILTDGGAAVSPMETVAAFIVDKRNLIFFF